MHAVGGWAPISVTCDGPHRDGLSSIEASLHTLAAADRARSQTSGPGASARWAPMSASASVRAGSLISMLGRVATSSIQWAAHGSPGAAAPRPRLGLMRQLGALSS
jgi:hypothetical protein